MKSIYLVLMFCILSFAFQAQITVTNATFPASGDKLKLAENSAFSGTLNLGNVGGPQVWDFSVLNTGNVYTESYQKASNGKDAGSYTDADMFIDTDGQEEYFKTSATKIEGLGFGGTNPIFGAPVVVRYTKRPILRSAPLTFIGSTSSTGEFKLFLPASVFPDTLLSAFGSFAPDSVRIEFVSSKTGLMDAYGTLKMQGKSVEVLREKAAVKSQTKIFLKVPLLGWQNLDFLLSIAQIEVPEFIDGFLGLNETTEYNFYSNTHKEVLVSASYDSLNVLENLVFADLGGVTSSTKDINVLSVGVYPNPVSDILKIQTPEWKKGMYLITISDIAGKIVYAEPTELNSDTTKEVNVSKLDKGIYLLSIRDQFNTFTGTAKFIVH